MSNQTTAIDAKTFAIGVLSITACILFVGFLLVSMQPAPAYAIGQNDRSGDYIMLTQQLTSSHEGLIVTDAAAKKMILYGFDFNAKSLRIVDGFNLERLRKPRGQ